MIINKHKRTISNKFNRNNNKKKITLTKFSIFCWTWQYSRWQAGFWVSSKHRIVRTSSYSRIMYVVFHEFNEHFCLCYYRVSELLILFFQRLSLHIIRCFATDSWRYFLLTVHMFGHISSKELYLSLYSLP